MRTPIELKSEQAKLHARWLREYKRILQSAAKLRKIDQQVARLGKRMKAAKRMLRDDKRRHDPLPIQGDGERC